MRPRNVRHARGKRAEPAGRDACPVAAETPPHESQGSPLANHRTGLLHRGSHLPHGGAEMIRKLSSGQYRLYSRKIDPRTGRRRNLGTFASRVAAEKHERAVQFFKRAH